MSLAWQPPVGPYTWPEALLLEATGWRIPSLKELESIVDYGRINPSVDPMLFPNMPLDQYWTSTDDAINPGIFRWCVDFMTGSAVKVQASDPRERHHIMLVQGTMEPSVFVARYGEVTDTTKNLMWKQDYEMLDPEHPGTWQDRKDCFRLVQGQERAANDRTGGFSDWRLPTVRELRSLIDEGHMRVHQTTDGVGSYATNAAFHETPFQAWFWSCTPALDIYGNANVWAVNFDAGVDVGNPPIYQQYVRLVRDCAAAPVVPFVTDPQVVLDLYHECYRFDVVSVNDPNVLYWARDKDFPGAFLRTWASKIREILNKYGETI